MNLQVFSEVQDNMAVFVSYNSVKLGHSLNIKCMLLKSRAPSIQYTTLVSSSIQAFLSSITTNKYLGCSSSESKTEDQDRSRNTNVINNLMSRFGKMEQLSVSSSSDALTVRCSGTVHRVGYVCFRNDLKLLSPGWDVCC